MNDTPWPDTVHDGLGGPQHYPTIITAPISYDCVIGGCDHGDDGCPTADQLVCAVCAVPDTGDFGNCDAIISAEWPCPASNGDSHG